MNSIGDNNNFSACSLVPTAATNNYLHASSLLLHSSSPSLKAQPTGSGGDVLFPWHPLRKSRSSSNNMSLHNINNGRSREIFMSETFYGPTTSPKSKSTSQLTSITSTIREDGYDDASLSKEEEEQEHEDIHEGSEVLCTLTSTSLDSYMFDDFYTAQELILHQRNNQCDIPATSCSCSGGSFKSTKIAAALVVPVLFKRIVAHISKKNAAKK